MTKKAYSKYMKRNRKFHKAQENKMGKQEFTYVFNDETNELSVYAHGNAALKIRTLLFNIGAKQFEIVN
jgi:hypothetical protein